MSSQTITHNHLDRILWIGGSPCAGKSTVAGRLAGEGRLRTYVCDDEIERHVRLATPERQPVFARLSAASCDGLWMRLVAQQVDEEIAYYREEFPLILADLGELLSNDAAADGPALIAEGAALLPALLAGIEVPPTRAVWMVPTPEFQRAQYERRDWRHDVLRECTDPAEAWERWMARDAGFARRVLAEAAALGYPSIVVDGSRNIDEIEAEVAARFGLTRAALRAGA